MINDLNKIAAVHLPLKNNVIIMLWVLLFKTSYNIFGQKYINTEFVFARFLTQYVKQKGNLNNNWIEELE